MDKKIVSYEILNAIDLVNLKKLVNDAINSGWQPLGSVSVATDHDNIYDIDYPTYFQAVIKYEQ